MLFEDLELTIKKLHKYCLKLSKSPWEAEDLVQETMFKVYRIHQADPTRKLTYSFLYTVAKNLFIDGKRKSRETFTIDEEEYGFSSDSLDFDSIIESLLLTLPMQQAMLLVMKDVFLYSIKEIALMLRIREESVKTALHRSRKKLREAKPAEKHFEVSNPRLLASFSQAIKESNPHKLFFYYRLLVARKFQVRKSVEQSVFHVVDPDGNILEIMSKK